MENLLTDMTPDQRVALEQYLLVDEDYNPPSFKELSKRMLECGYQVSDSTLQRWSKKFEFEKYLKQQIDALVLADEERSKEIAAAAGDENFKRTLLSLEDNAELTHGAYKGLKVYLKQVNDKVARNEKVTQDEVKILIKIYAIASARDDKLLDRKTYLAGVERLTKSDLLAQLSNTDIDMEESIDVDIDVEIDDE
jgi:hypothetical protein